MHFIGVFYIIAGNVIQTTESEYTRTIFMVLQLAYAKEFNSLHVES